MVRGWTPGMTPRYDSILQQKMFRHDIGVRSGVIRINPLKIRCYRCEISVRNKLIWSTNEILFLVRHYNNPNFGELPLKLRVTRLSRTAHLYSLIQKK